MPQPTKPGIDWAEIQTRLKAGESANSLGKQYDVSKQGILKRAKKEGWLTPAPITRFLATARQPTAPAAKGSPERKAEILGYLTQGLSYTIAAMRAGIGRQTLSNWRKDDVQFGNACEEAIALWASSRIETIEHAGDRGDWKASAYLLERNEGTKPIFAQDKGQGGGTNIQVVLNIPRPEPVQMIDVEAVVVEDA
jgi:hypothetical protein